MRKDWLKPKDDRPHLSSALPCPFCGTHQIVEDRRSLLCLVCAAQGPIPNTGDQPLDLEAKTDDWNARGTLPRR